VAWQIRNPKHGRMSELTMVLKTPKMEQKIPGKTRFAGALGKKKSNGMYPAGSD